MSIAIALVALLILISLALVAKPAQELIVSKKTVWLDAWWRLFKGKGGSEHDPEVPVGGSDWLDEAGISGSGGGAPPGLQSDDQLAFTKDEDLPDLFCLMEAQTEALRRPPSGAISIPGEISLSGFEEGSFDKDFIQRNAVGSDPIRARRNADRRRQERRPPSKREVLKQTLFGDPDFIGAESLDAG